jgi:hypothetical protein
MVAIENPIEAQMDRAWQLLQGQTKPNEPLADVVYVPDLIEKTQQLRDTSRPNKHLLVTYAAKRDHSKVIVMEGTSKGASWTLAYGCVESVLQIAAALGFDTNDLRDES